MKNCIIGIGMYGSEDEKSPVEQPFKSPSGIKRFDGYGADTADLERGYRNPDIHESPAYDKANYLQRSTAPRKSDDDFGNTGVLEDDYAFRRKDQESRGFLTRPTRPTER